LKAVIKLACRRARQQSSELTSFSSNKISYRENDTTPAWNRILGSENGPVLDLCLMVLKIIREFEKNNFKLEK
jgi:hypothetical protein